MPRRVSAPRAVLGCRLFAASLWALWPILLALLAGQAAAQADGPRYDPAAVFPEADRFGPVEGEPPAAPAYSNGELVGYVFVTTDIVAGIGYSGRPIDVAVGLTLDGTIAGAQVIDHAEPILLVGVPEQELLDFAANYAGTRVLDVDSQSAARVAEIDIIAGATVTAMVVDDSIISAARQFARARGLAGLGAIEGARAGTVDRENFEPDDWLGLLGDGSVRRLNLSVGDVDAAFDAAGGAAADAPSESDDPADTFIDLYIALLDTPTIGRNLLGEAEYNNVLRDLGPDDHAILVAGNGLFSFKGSGYVRGGIFDRIQAVQGDISFRFRDRDHRRLGDLEAEGAPRFTEIAVFRIPADAGFDPLADWRLELLVNRAIGAIDRVYTGFEVNYHLPDRYVIAPPTPVVEAESPDAGPVAVAEALEQPVPLWQRIWQTRVLDIAILCGALFFLTIVFFCQEWLVKRPKLLLRVRVGFLIFTTVWIGGWATAQLSVVNIFTFFSAARDGFQWEFFLLEPLIFILWFSVATALLFWGRGAYCGWLCPFGALQELLNRAARNLGVPQFRMPWVIHERLWALKYLIFLGLFGIALYDIGPAEVLSEVEPFKTAVVLQFDREWYFVLYAVVLLIAGLFMERFFCRYLCPLGAALAIPGRLRMFDWFRRRRQCGAECQLCAKQCMVQAILPDGRIHPNECLYCLHCQEVYWDEHKCPPLAQRRKKQEERLAKQAEWRAKQAALATAPGAAAAPAHPTSLPNQ